MSRKLAVPLALAATLAMHDATAGSAPPVQFQAKAVVAGNCTVSETGTLDFGSYDPLVTNVSGVAQPGSGASMSLLCTRGSHPHIAMDNGANGTRVLFTGTGGANKQLSYDIVMPNGNGATATATTTSWGATAATKYDVGVTAVAPSTATVVEIFGTIPGGQDVIPGTYNDTVTATVDF